MARPPTCPMTRRQAADRYFLEHRAKLLDLAAFLDRLDRAAGDGEDARVAELRSALAILLDGRGDRARRVLEHFSDPTVEPVAHAAGKGAVGAYLANGLPG